MCVLACRHTGPALSPPPSLHRDFAILLGLLGPCHQPLPAGESQAGPGWPREGTQGVEGGYKRHGPGLQTQVAEAAGPLGSVQTQLGMLTCRLILAVIC